MKSVTKKEFQKYFHKHTRNINEPILVTKHGKPEFYVVNTNFNPDMISFNLTLNSSGEITNTEVVKNE